MTEQQTIMERLFRSLDERAKTLNSENGQSFIESLRLAAEQVYTNEQGLLEQSTLQDQREIFQFTCLSLMQEEKIQANHQIMPDSIELILGFLVEQFMNNQEELRIVDIASGTGRLSATVKEVLPEIAVMHYLIEADLVLSRVGVHLANFLGIPPDVYPQDAIVPLPLEEADIVIGDLPVGYCPIGERGRDFKLSFEGGHSYSYYLLIEQAMDALEDVGYAFLMVPSNIFTGEHVKQLEKYIATETKTQAFLNLPPTLFKNERTRKSILILQKRKSGETKPVEVLLANIPSFKNPPQFQEFMTGLDQ